MKGFLYVLSLASWFCACKHKLDMKLAYSWLQTFWRKLEFCGTWVRSKFIYTPYDESISEVHSILSLKLATKVE